jgi:hypothetical protein
VGIISQSIAHTPIWVYVLFVFLVYRGLKSLRPRETTLGALALIPGIFMIIGIGTLARRFGLVPSIYALWLVALVAGAGVGWLLLRNKAILVDRARGALFRPADYTALPLILRSFAVKFAFGVVGFLHPERIHQASLGMIEGTGYGFFCGIFVGKFANYTARYLNQPSVGLPSVVSEA